MLFSFEWNMYECSPDSVLNEVLEMHPEVPRIQTVHVVDVPNWHDWDWVTLKRSPHVCITVDIHSDKHLSVRGMREAQMRLLRKEKIKDYVHGGTESYYHPEFWHLLMSKILGHYTTQPKEN